MCNNAYIAQLMVDICVYVCVNMYTYTYIHMYIYICYYMYIHICIHMYLHTYTRIYIASAHYFVTSQCLAAWCSVLQHVVVCLQTQPRNPVSLLIVTTTPPVSTHTQQCCSVLKCVAECCNSCVNDS